MDNSSGNAIKPIRVLLVEDDPDDINTIKELLQKKEGKVFEIEQVERLATAIKRISSGNIDVILLDLTLPDCSGFDSFTRIHKLDENIPIVILSSSESRKFDVEILHEGVHNFLFKEEIDADSLEQNIEEALSQQSLSRNLRKRQNQLQADEARARHILEKNLEAVIIVDRRKGTMRFVNPAAERLLDKKAEELLHQPFAFPLELKEQSEFEIFHKDGTKIICEIRLVEVEWEGENSFLASFRDISARKIAEKELTKRLCYEEGLARCSRVLLKEGDGATIVGIEYLLEASGACRVYIFENFSDPEHGLCMRQTHEVCAHGVKTQIDNPELMHFPYKNGFERWQKFLSLGEPVGGLVEKFPEYEQSILSQQDILSILVLPIIVNKSWHGFIGFDDTKSKRPWSTEDVRLLQTAAELIGARIARKRTEETLKNQNNLMQTLINSIPEPIFFKDEKCRYIGCNRAFEDLMGIKNKDIIGKKVYDVASEELAQLCDKIDQELLQKGGEKIHQTEIRYADGKIHFVNLHKAGFEKNDGSTGGIVGAIIDISAQKSIEEELKQLKKKYQKLLEGTDASTINDY
ncbi:PAS domain S-box protein [Candidatus Riflebacteria bacterium]